MVVDILYNIIIQTPFSSVSQMWAPGPHVGFGNYICGLQDVFMGFETILKKNYINNLCIIYHSLLICYIYFIL